MSTKSFATELRDTIKALRDEQGVVEIKCDNLIKHLEQVINSPEEEVSPHELERYKAELQAWVKHNEHAHAQNLELFKSVIASGQNALKTAFLMNGGATVALLAFLGKLSDEHNDKIPVFATAMVVFVSGVLVITMAAGVTYLAQWFYAQHGTPKRKIGNGFNVLAIVLNITSYICFICGAKMAYEAFLKF